MFLPKVNFLTNCLPSALLLAIAPIIGNINPVLAQNTISVCQAPRPGEYLLLVVSPTVNNQQQLRSALPSDLNTVTCKYFNETVTRVGGFNKIDDANRWARYINNVVGLSAIITTRPQSPTVRPAVVPSAPVQTNPNIRYNPRILGQGFAVLVDYFNRPELAASVQRLVGGNVGLVSYGERPYLLAVYTTNQTQAYRTLQQLTDNGFFAMLADGRKVVLLRSMVNLR